jgi:hypothetical protein
LRSDPKRSHNGRTKLGDDGTASDGYNTHRGSLGHSEQQGSATTISQIPLVHLGPKANDVSEPSPASGHVNEPTEMGNGKVARGFDAV